MKSRYAFFKAHSRGLPEEQARDKLQRAGFTGVTIIPGLGQWMLVHLGKDCSKDELPPNFILASHVINFLNTSCPG